MSDEKLRILEMIKDGTITPDEGLELLNAVGSKQEPLMGFMESDESGGATEGSGKKPRWLYIKVQDDEKGKNVNIRIPIALAKFANKFIPKHAHAEMKAQGVELDLDGILKTLEDTGQNNLIEIEDGNKKVVQIFTK